MDDDAGACLVALIGLFFLIPLVLGVIIAGAVFGAIYFVIGAASSLLIWLLAHAIDWPQADGRWIWLVMAFLVLTPVAAWVFYWADQPFIRMLGYPVWLAGYIWACFAPLFTDFRGMADVVATTVFIEMRMRLEMWKVSIRVKVENLLGM